MLAPACSLTCETLGNVCVNRVIRFPGCYCKHGYVENCNKMCVKASEYCRMCPVNEYYSDCGIVPEPTCQNPALQGNQTQPKCVCKGGYYRDYDGNCVLPQQCPSKFYKKYELRM